MTGAPLNKSEPAWYEIPILRSLYLGKIAGSGNAGDTGSLGYGRGGRTIAVISIKQSYLRTRIGCGNHSRYRSERCIISGKYTIVVDEDIDPQTGMKWLGQSPPGLTPRPKLKFYEGIRTHPWTQLYRRISEPGKITQWRESSLMRADHGTGETNLRRSSSSPPEMRKQVNEKFGYLWA